ncbi:MAG: hypothetical protein U0894_05655 [Pirellulales bacterium]
MPIRLVLRGIVKLGRELGGNAGEEWCVWERLCVGQTWKGNAMQINQRARLVWGVPLVLLGMLGLLVGAAYGQEEGIPAKREQIGESLGKPVYRDQIRTKGFTLREELHRLFSGPASEKYHKEHEKEITPTKEEIASVAKQLNLLHAKKLEEEGADLRSELKELEKSLANKEFSEGKKEKLELRIAYLQTRLTPPGEQFAMFLLMNWKFQRHLYDKFGGGRILWQQAGLEAFDAMHKWLESMEAAGEFKISDPKLRATFYEYWTTMKHGAFLTADKERIQKEFLEPEWMPKQEAK